MGFLVWIVVGLIAGWLAGQVMKGGGYGVVVDIILGLLGGLLAGWIFSALGIWSSVGLIGSIIDRTKADTILNVLPSVMILLSPFVPSFAS